MNSASARDRGGSVALVDGGNVLLGLPGGPGCTTTGFAGSVCRESVTTIPSLCFTAMKRCVRSGSEADIIAAIRGEGLFAALAQRIAINNTTRESRAVDLRSIGRPSLTRGNPHQHTSNGRAAAHTAEIRKLKLENGEEKFQPLPGTKPQGQGT
jgi:hypothetical protein